MLFRSNLKNELGQAQAQLEKVKIAGAEFGALLRYIEWELNAKAGCGGEKTSRAARP